MPRTVVSRSSNFAAEFERKNKKKVTKKELKRKSDYRLRRWTTDEVGGPDGLILQIMTTDFILFWRLYAPLRDYSNRYRACERLWNAMDEHAKALILRQLGKENAERSPPERRKNPYFFLIDWQPPQPTNYNGRALQKGVRYVIALWDGKWGTYTEEEARAYGMEVK